MNELAFGNYLRPKLNIIHSYNSSGQVWSYYGLNITEEFSNESMIPSYCDAYLVLVDNKYRFYDKHKYSFKIISQDYAHALTVSKSYENFIDFEIWVKDKNNFTTYYTCNKFSNITKNMIIKLISDFESYEDNNDEFSMIPKTCFSKYKTLEYMQYKHVNDREIKEWVGSATIINNGIHSPRKTVKAGHIIDKNKVVHQLYMNDYILRTSEENVFVIISEDVFNRLFEPYGDDESYELIHNMDEEGCQM